ncbi:hypothetical protein RJ639_028579, partial [Escallonia herrerae]
YLLFPSSYIQHKSRREILQEYVKNVKPEFMEIFVKRAPQQVVEAMRQTVTNMIGTLPPQFFAVTVTTVAENLAQLMYSVLMTGYMFRNAQYRLELQQSVEQVALPDTQNKKHQNHVCCSIKTMCAAASKPCVLQHQIVYEVAGDGMTIWYLHLVGRRETHTSKPNGGYGVKWIGNCLGVAAYVETLIPLICLFNPFRRHQSIVDILRPYYDVPDYAPGTQKKVTGEVIRWNNVSGIEKIDAVKYIELLEAEIEELNRQVGRKSVDGQNELLEYLKSLEPQNLQELTSSAGEDVVLAMNTFIKRLLSVADPGQMKTSVTETSASELAKLLYWLMVVGYSIRNIEVCFDMERVLGAPPKLAELPPGEDI